MWKKYVLSLDLNLDSESQRTIVSGNEFQTVGAEQRKARFAESVLVNGLSSSGDHMRVSSFLIARESV